ncbi:MAG: preprotein translocase subunit SecG [Clostridiaceae bacterium]|nr:preprotein translocase subunit SecG [Clostridiaceae bacterium]
MEVVKYIVLGIYLVICIAVIIIATIQTKDSQGASGTITGSSTSNFYEKNKGRTKVGKLKKWTIILSVLFAVLAILLGILYVI